MSPALLPLCWSLTKAAISPALTWAVSALNRFDVGPCLFDCDAGAGASSTGEREAREDAGRVDSVLITSLHLIATLRVWLPDEPWTGSLALGPSSPHLDAVPFPWTLNSEPVPPSTPGQDATAAASVAALRPWFAPTWRRSWKWQVANRSL